MVGDGWYDLLEKWLGEDFGDFIESWGIYGNNWFYLTRSPASGYGYGVRCVNPAGAFSNRYAYSVFHAVRPALNLKSEILVSEIKH